MAKDENKARALAALLDANNFTSAAAAAGISRRTLYGYLYEDADFAREYRRQRDLRTIERAERSENEREGALNAIRAVMDDPEQPGMVRLKAAQTLLDRVEKDTSAATGVAQAALDSHFSLFENFTWSNGL